MGVECVGVSLFDRPIHSDTRRFIQVENGPERKTAFLCKQGVDPSMLSQSGMVYWNKRLCWPTGFQYHAHGSLTIIRVKSSAGAAETKIT